MKVIVYLTALLLPVAAAAQSTSSATGSVTMPGTIVTLSSCKASTCFAIKPDTMTLVPPKGMKVLATFPQAALTQRGVVPDTVRLPGRVDTLVTHDTTVVTRVDTVRVPVATKDSTSSTKPATPGALVSVQVNLASTSLTVGATTQASYALHDASGASISGSATWGLTNGLGTPDSSIVSISSSGLVTALKPGTAYVVAYVGTTYGYAIVTVTAPSSTTTPPTSPSDPSTVLASANFDDGTYGSLTNETPGHNAIVDDPTNSGHGKVLQISYIGSGASADLNQQAAWDPTNGPSHGATFFFRGQVYFPASIARFNAPLRKLIYFRTNLGTSGKQFDYVINMFGTDVGLEITGPSQADTRWSTGFQMPQGQWVTLEVSIAMNSAPGKKDGSTTVWINGNQVLSKTGIAFTQASDPTTTRWSWLAVGTQREGTVGDGAINEARYWDTITFATARVP